MSTLLPLLLAPALASQPHTPTPQKVAIEAVAIAHCTRSPSTGGLVPSTTRPALDRALSQRIDRGQLVSRPLLLTHVGEPASMVTGHRLPDGTDDHRFALAVDSAVRDEGVVEYTVSAEIHGTTSRASFGGTGDLGWVLTVPAAPDLRCRGKRAPETVVAVYPHLLEPNTTIESVRAQLTPERLDTPTRGDLLADVLDSLPQLFRSP